MFQFYLYIYNFVFSGIPTDEEARKGRMGGSETANGKPGSKKQFHKSSLMARKNSENDNADLTSSPKKQGWSETHTKKGTKSQDQYI